MLFQNTMKLLQKYGMNFLNGLGTTLLLALISVAIGCVIGALVAILRLGKSKVLRAVATVYTEVIRDTPLLLQLYFFYFLLPDILPALKLSKFACITIALVINSGAYMAELIRGGINSVDRGQMEAGRSLGMSKLQAMRKIIFPQALRYILPAIGNELIALLKETAVAGYVAVVDLTRAGNLVRNNTYDAVNPLLIVAATYLILVVALTKLLWVFERRLSNRDHRK